MRTKKTSGLYGVIHSIVKCNPNSTTDELFAIAKSMFPRDNQKWLRCTVNRYKYHAKNNLPSYL